MEKSNLPTANEMNTILKPMMFIADSFMRQHISRITNLPTPSIFDKERTPNFQAYTTEKAIEQQAKIHSFYNLVLDKCSDKVNTKDFKKMALFNIAVSARLRLLQGHGIIPSEIMKTQEYKDAVMNAELPFTEEYLQTEINLPIEEFKTKYAVS